MSFIASFIAAYWPVLVSVLLVAACAWWWLARRKAGRVLAAMPGSPRQTWFPMGARDRDLDEESDFSDRSRGDDSLGD